MMTNLELHHQTIERFRELIDTGHIERAKFIKMHHQGTAPERHLEYMEKIAGHNCNGPNQKISDWINRRWERLLSGSVEIVVEPSLNPKAGPLNMQVGGDHYLTRAIQPVEYIEANGLPFLDACIVKRVTRHADKDGAGVTDLKKIIHEAKLIASLRYGEEI